MLDLPDLCPLKITQSASPAARSAFDALEHLLVVCAVNPSAAALRKIPQGTQLAQLLARAAKRGGDLASSRLANRRGTGVTIAAFKPSTAFAELTWAAKVIAECRREKPAQIGIVLAGLDEDTERRATAALIAAAHAAAFDLPSFKTADPQRAPRLRSLRLLGLRHRPDLPAAAAAALGNNLARWLTVLPPNVLTAASYRDAIERLCRDHGIEAEFLGEADLEKLGAGAFLAVARGNATRDAGIMRLRYRPSGAAEPALALVGKGILFDTGGTNLKPFKGMLEMHGDMQGSAVALGALLALAALRAPYAADAWLAITENRLAPDAYKSQDLVRAANGTTIQVIHTDAEGRMVLADALALAAREKPQLIVDYATLTGACVAALTERYSGVFSNRPRARELLIDAGAVSGERVWPFPLDADFDEHLKSDIADIKQCAIETPGDHILAARFLGRFVPDDIAWVHMDLSAGQHKGGLAHVPTEITGFGVRFTLELLRMCEGPSGVAARIAA